MSLRPSWRPDLPKESFPGDRTSEVPATPSDAARTIADLAARLAQAGGGALSVDLALDLILNEIVEQARRDTRASGAAIALAREREMICRATAGNAPELGTPVDASEGLSAACLKTGAIQECSDTERDPRVDRDACRALHIGSMLLVPIIQDGTACGILEVFSSVPNNFAKDDVEILYSLTNKIVTAKKAAASGAAEQRSPRDSKTAPPQAQTAPPLTVNAGAESSNVSSLAGSSQIRVRNEVLSIALVVLVVVAAILLGLVIGVRQMAKRAAVAQSPGSPDAVNTTPTGVPPSAPPITLPTQVAPRVARGPENPPAGGLVVTQNGKVIYRADAPGNSTKEASEAERTGRRLLHRVEPEYPEAAKSQRIQGAVVLEAHVLSDGTVGNIAVLQGDPLLAEAATQAVKQWKYQPYYVDGQAVDRQERITVKFTLPSS